ncbi:MAG: hypothetical protein JXR61_04685 [Prolixibacteraceae bacterium]|nr:hypothetical protein [Prolixibacteraceae bacterium]
MKKIYGFQIKIDGKKICRAGFEKENSVVSCILSSIRRAVDDSEELAINVGGLNSDTNQHVDWLDTKLQLGDKITIEVISTDFDLPKTIREPKPKQDVIAQKLERYHLLKEELKEYL